MSDEQERLAKNLNAAAETVGGCVGCYVWLLVLAAVPMIAVALYMVVGYSLSEADPVSVVVGVAVFVVLVRLMRRR